MMQVKSFLIDCWELQLCIQERRYRETSNQRANLIQNIMQENGNYIPETFEGENGDCIELVACLLITLANTEFVRKMNGIWNLLMTWYLWMAVEFI